MKNPTTKDLYDLIEYQGKQMSDFKLDMLKFKDDMLEFKDDMLEFKDDMLEFKSDINKKLDNHIVEFKSFKSDMLSLPTISKELKNK